MGSRTEGTRGAVLDCMGAARLADWETKDSQPLAVKSWRIAKVGETPSLTGEFIGKWG